MRDGRIEARVSVAIGPAAGGVAAIASGVPDHVPRLENARS